ncbi:MAG: hypothetical protein NUV56_03065 [Candidatus Uhrbacteria bacterium]|nr:hypothetical protein [Candidatus Uhrbacteria bacterium]
MSKAPLLFLGTISLLLANTFVVHSPLLGLITLGAWLASVGGPFGALAAPQANGAAQRSLGALLVIAVLSITGSALYYATSVTTGGLLTIIIGISLTSLVLGRKHIPAKLGPWPQTHGSEWAALGIGALGIAAWWSAVSTVTITEAVRSPWLELDPRAIIAIAVSAAAATLLAMRGHRLFFILVLAGITFSITSMSAQLYPLGYGFDPFLHRATVSHIIEHGTITPKPLYYIGQYALELTATKIFALPLFSVDIFLAPILLALAIIGLISTSKKSLTSWLVLFLLPFAAFIPTTPQAIAYVFALLTLWSFLAWEGKGGLGRIASWIFGIATIITHPLAGIPTLTFLVLATTLTHRHARPTLFTAAAAAITAFGAVALPLVFLLQARIGGLDLTWSSTPFDLARLPLSGFFGNAFSSWMDALYLVAGNALLITLLFAITGSRPFAKRTNGERALVLVILALVVNFLILSLAFDFTFLIAYERTDFAVRLLVLMAIFALPLASNAVEATMQRVRNAPLLLATLPCLLLALLAASGTYAAYPRHDGYTRSAGFNVSTADIDAVHAIANDAGDTPYAVLANQAVSAAAVNEFGFKHYFPGDIFYYPIPTGGPLYDIFLTMVDDAPTHEHAELAMQLTGSDTVYLVVNDYWWQSDKIIATAKEQADRWFALNDGAITIFAFTRSE